MTLIGLPSPIPLTALIIRFVAVILLLTPPLLSTISSPAARVTVSPKIVSSNMFPVVVISTSPAAALMLL
jgi:hypothetical protein